MITDYIKQLKKENNLKIVDVHVHPFDVMGVVHYSDFDTERRVSYAPGMSDKMKFGRTAKVIGDFANKFMPKKVFQEIESVYSNPDEKIVLSEMRECLVDNLVFLSLDPWANPFQVKEIFNNKEFHLLGSIDIHHNKLEEIKSSLRRQVDELGIIGIKLHPNLQNFKPQPSHNSPEIAEKLKAIYKFAEDNDIYLHFHGGKSNYTKDVNPKFVNHGRSKDNGIISNFINRDGSSELFGQYNIPIIIAHLGHFAQSKIDAKSIGAIAKYDNVFFDTTAVPPKMIFHFLKLVGSDKMLLGSDAFYYKMSYAIKFVYEAVEKFDNKNKDKHLLKILGNNFFGKICKKF